VAVCGLNPPSGVGCWRYHRRIVNRFELAINRIRCLFTAFAAAGPQSAAWSVSRRQSPTLRRTVWEAEGRPPCAARIDELLEEREILTKIDTPRMSRGGRLALRPVHSVRP
jgi:hypothetical protein